jgi:putative SOS response-associated peptidase YedK
MCGRVYEIYVAEELSDRYLDSETSVPFEVSPTYNLCPTDNSPVLLVTDGKREFEQMRWQLVPRTEPAFSTKLSTINARSESVFESRLYRDIVVRQRCIIPISGFYEWKRHGTARRPFRISLREDPIMSLAGIWDAWRAGTKDERHSFSILTTAANEFMSAIHDRMPVILSRSDEEAWLDPGFGNRVSLERLLKPCPSELLEGAEVSTLVNSTKNNSPELLKPVEAGDRTARKSPTLFDL